MLFVLVVMEMMMMSSIFLFHSFILVDKVLLYEIIYVNRIMTKPGLVCHEQKVAFCNAIELSLVTRFFEDGSKSNEMLWACFIAEKGTTKKEITKLFKHTVANADGKLIVLDQSFLYLSQVELNAFIKGSGCCIAYCFMHVTLLIISDLCQSKLTYAFNVDINYSLNFDKIKGIIEGLGSSNIRVWGLKILTDLAYLMNLDLDLQYSAWKKLCEGRVISLLCSGLENTVEWSLGLSEEDSFVVEKYFSLLQVLVELTDKIEATETDECISEELQEIWDKLSLLEFKNDSKQQTRQHPTINLKKSIDTFEMIHAAFPQISLKDFTILQLYRIRGELRSKSNGLVPEAQVSNKSTTLNHLKLNFSFVCGQLTLDCLINYALHGIETQTTFTGYGTGPLVIEKGSKDFVLLERTFAKENVNDDDIQEAKSMKNNEILDLEGISINALAEMLSTIRTAKKNQGKFVSLPTLPENMLKYFNFICEIYNSR